MEQPNFNNLSREPIERTPIEPPKPEIKKHEEFPSIQKPEDLKKGEQGILRAFHERLGNKMSDAALAAALFVGASSQYAEAQTPPQLIETEKISSEDSFLKQVFKRSEVTLGTNRSVIEPFRGESISSFALSKSSYYHDVLDRVSGFNVIFWTALGKSKNAAEFREYLSQEMPSEKAKVFALQWISAGLYNVYNRDMYDRGEFVEISDDAMFDSLCRVSHGIFDGSGGICGNISTFVARSAQAMNIEAWVQNASPKEYNHIVAGLMLKYDNRDEIGFIDRDSLIRTGTTDYKDALGILERDQRGIKIFGSAVEMLGRRQVKVWSKANEVLEGASGMKDVSREIERELGAGTVVREVNGMKIGLSKEFSTLGLNSDHVAISVSHFENKDSDPYQSISQMNSVRIGARGGTEQVSGEADVTYLHVAMKDLQNGTVNFDAIVPRIFGSYLNKQQITSGNFGEFSANLGATIQAAIALPMSGTFDSRHRATSTLDTSFGGRVIYMDPSKTGRFYVGASETLQMGFQDFQTSKIVPKESAQKISAGAEIKVQEAGVLNFGAVCSRYEWGTGTELSAGHATPDTKIGVTYKKDSSSVERFVPSTQSVGVIASHQVTPNVEIRFTGLSSTEQYKGSAPHKNVGGAVTVVIKGF